MEDHCLNCGDKYMVYSCFEEEDYEPKCYICHRKENTMLTRPLTYLAFLALCTFAVYALLWLAELRWSAM